MDSNRRTLSVPEVGKDCDSLVHGITNTPQQERSVWFSKDGKTLYYAAERNGHWGIWETSLTDKDDKYFTYAVKMEEKLVTKPGETCFQPQVSPDGEKIAYLKDRTAIAVMDIKSGKEKIVLDRNVNYSYSDGDQSFAWSPDSRYILCNYQADGGWNNENVALIDVEKGDIEQDLVTIVPGIQSSISCIVVKHGNVKVLVMKGNVRVLICGGFGGIGIIHLGSS